MRLPPELKAKVVAVIAFGDPMRGMSNAWPINNPSVNLAPRSGRSGAQNIASFCNTGDMFCSRPGYSLPAHLAYARDGT